MLVEASQWALAQTLVQHDAPINLTNRDGKTVMELAVERTSSEPDFQALLDDIQHRSKKETEREEHRAAERERENHRHRQRQRTLAAQHADNQQTRRGLGRMEDFGWGYFPSLAALQFQSAIPPPVSQTREQEKECRQVELILNTIGIMVVVYFILC